MENQVLSILDSRLEKLEFSHSTSQQIQQSQSVSRLLIFQLRKELIVLEVNLIVSRSLDNLLKLHTKNANDPIR